MKTKMILLGILLVFLLGCDTEKYEECLNNAGIMYNVYELDDISEFNKNVCYIMRDFNVSISENLLNPDCSCGCYTNDEVKFFCDKDFCIRTDNGVCEKFIREG